jgi:hypothetical protein
MQHYQIIGSVNVDDSTDGPIVETTRSLSRGSSRLKCLGLCPILWRGSTLLCLGLLRSKQTVVLQLQTSRGISIYGYILLDAKHVPDASHAKEDAQSLLISDFSYSPRKSPSDRGLEHKLLCSPPYYFILMIALFLLRSPLLPRQLARHLNPVPPLR